MNVIVRASDDDAPANQMRLSLDPGAPPDMTIASNGLIQWIAGPSFAGTTNRITVRVTDDGVPSMSTTQAFNVTVTAQAQLRLTAERNVQGELRLSLSGDVGRAYFVEASVDLVTWTLLITFVSDSATTKFVDPQAQDTQRRFYRTISP